MKKAYSLTPEELAYVLVEYLNKQYAAGLDTKEVSVVGMMNGQLHQSFELVCVASDSFKPPA